MGNWAAREAGEDSPVQKPRESLSEVPLALKQWPGRGSIFESRSV